MIYWSFISFAVALTSGLLGFGGSETELAWLGQALFFVFLVLSVVLVAMKMAREEYRPGEEVRETE